jgi:hypothetical protein
VAGRIQHGDIHGSEALSFRADRAPAARHVTDVAQPPAPCMPHLGTQLPAAYAPCYEEPTCADPLSVHFAHCAARAAACSARANHASGTRFPTAYISHKCKWHAAEIEEIMRLSPEEPSQTLYPVHMHMGDVPRDRHHLLQPEARGQARR